MSETELVALRRRVAELQAENYQLKEKAGVFPGRQLVSSVEELTDELIRPETVFFRVVASWDLKIDPSHQQFHCLGHSGVGENELHYRYFMEDPRRLRRNQALTTMEHLHLRLIQQLATHWVFPDDLSDSRRVGG